MKLLITFLSFLFISFSIYAQKNTGIGQISGIITDSINEPLPYATVVLKNIKKEIIEGTVTEERGNFVFTKLNKGEYFLEIQYIGFISIEKSIKISDNKKSIDLGSIALKEDSKTLEEVIVKGEASEVSLKLGKKVFRVGKDITTQGGVATDVLNNVPSVNVSPNGTISLRGNSNVQILINGRRSGLTQTQALEQLSADVIEKIEVITNPSAKYDASGGAGIINIILKKNRKSGLNGQVRLVAGIPDDYRALGNVNFKTKKFNFFTNLGIRYTNYEGDYSKKQETIKNGVTTYLTQNEDENRHDDGKLFYFGTDYYLNAQNTITLAYYRNETEDTDTTSLDYDISTSMNIKNSISTLGNSKEKRDYNQLEANYTKEFDSSNTKFTIDFQYDFWNSNKIWNLETEQTYPIKAPIATIQTSGITNTDDITIQTDYTTTTGKKGHLEFGGKYENRKIVNEFLAEELKNGSFEIINGINNKLNYKEKIIAAYTQYNTKINKFNFQFGLRLEATKVSIGSEIKQLNLKNNYTNLFPSATIGYEFKNNLSGQLSYSKRIRRPSLWQLNPFLELKDFTARFTGNPLLQPSYTDSFELSFNYRKKKFRLSPSLYYSDTKDVFQYETVEDSQGVFVQSPINLENEKRYGFELSGSYNPLKWLRFSGDFNAYNYKQTGIINSSDATISDKTWFVNLSTSIQIPKGVRLQTRMYHIGKRVNVQTTTLPITYMNFAVSKSLFKNNGNLILNISNPFNSSKVRENIVGSNYKINQIRNRNAQRFSLSFVYKFNQKPSDKNRSANRSNRN
ncbi:TonB-dependent receptor [uncultured Tenacibaculum sp.]|uniref:TonB-dependent receptor domain-containing protein n=1 Tax=uncultured Tenacibaculum sp. TaxID=174713 RepID=UPI0026281015|nr:TonB-dependent receptor [uncultured Tenacibaculum sp.]